MYAPKDLESEKFALEDDLEFRVVFLFFSVYVLVLTLTRQTFSM